MIGKLVLIASIVVAPVAAAAHQLIVFAESDCEAVTVEAKFSNGRVARQGEVRVFDGNEMLLMTLALTEDGTARFDLESVDYSGGLLVEVDTGGHDNYWVLTPDDIARNCGS